MRLRIVLLSAALAIVAAPAVSATKTVRVGQAGGWYCTSARDFVAMAIEPADRMNNLRPSCQALKAGTSLEVDDLTRGKEGFSVGEATIDGKTVSVAIVDDAAKEATPQPTMNRTFKRVSPDDVRNTPAKWKDRDIEFVNVNVYWVGSDDVRILTDSQLTLFAKKTRSADNSYFAANCETQDEAVSRKCKATVRFNYDFSGVDQPTGLYKRTVLRSSDVELIRPKGR